VETARKLGCDEAEVAFDQALKKSAKSQPAPEHDPKKRQPKWKKLNTSLG
jgi:hypothetical protein